MTRLVVALGRSQRTTTITAEPRERRDVSTLGRDGVLFAEAKRPGYSHLGAGQSGRGRVAWT